MSIESIALLRALQDKNFAAFREGGLSILKSRIDAVKDGVMRETLSNLGLQEAKEEEEVEIDAEPDDKEQDDAKKAEDEVLKEDDKEESEEECEDEGEDLEEATTNPAYAIFKGVLNDVKSIAKSANGGTLNGEKVKSDKYGGSLYYNSNNGSKVQISVYMDDEMSSADVSVLISGSSKNDTDANLACANTLHNDLVKMFKRVMNKFNIDEIEIAEKPKVINKATGATNSRVSLWFK